MSSISNIENGQKRKKAKLRVRRKKKIKRTRGTIKKTIKNLR